MPEWIHNRAEHLLAKNPDMKKSTAFAVATQQSHALGKTPRSYGTSEGKHEAKQKFDTPKDDVKAANPGDLKTPKLSDEPKRVWSGGHFEKKAMLDAFFDELQKIALTLPQKAVIHSAVRFGDPAELGALSQASRLAKGGNMPRANEIADNVMGFLKTKPALGRGVSAA